MAQNNATTTLAELRHRTYSVINEEENVANFPIDFVDYAINSNITSVLSSNPMEANGQQTRTPPFPFLQRSMFYSTTMQCFVGEETVAGGPVTFVDGSFWQTITGELVTVNGSSTIVANCHSFPKSGTLWIAGNIVKYTSRTDTEFRGCTGVEFAHPAGTAIYLLYQLPPDLGQISEVRYNSIIAIQYIPYANLLKQKRGQNWLYAGRRFRGNGAIINPDVYTPYQYTIIDSTYLLLVNVPESLDMVEAIYQKKAKVLVNSDDVTDIPNEFALAIIPYLAASDLYDSRDMFAQSDRLRLKGTGKLNEFYNFYIKQANESFQFNKIQTGKDFRYLRY